MSTELERPAATIGAEVTLCEEVPMVRRERWEEIRRLWVAERVPIAEIARRLDLDRKTVRRCLRDTVWRPYHRAVLVRATPAGVRVLTEGRRRRVAAFSEMLGTLPREDLRRLARGVDVLERALR